jgi:hypothetical protein
MSLGEGTELVGVMVAMMFIMALGLCLVVTSGWLFDASEKPLGDGTALAGVTVSMMFEKALGLCLGAITSGWLFDASEKPLGDGTVLTGVTVSMVFVNTLALCLERQFPNTTTTKTTKAPTTPPMIAQVLPAASNSSEHFEVSEMDPPQVLHASSTREPPKVPLQSMTNSAAAIARTETVMLHVHVI